MAEKGGSGRAARAPSLTAGVNATARRLRNLIERFFGKLKHVRDVANRYEEHAANYLAPVQLAATRIWMRVVSRSCLSYSGTSTRHASQPSLG